jgi:hypothetical protein
MLSRLLDLDLDGDPRPDQYFYALSTAAYIQNYSKIKVVDS